MGGGMKDVVGKTPRFLVALDFDNTIVRHSAKTMINVQPLFTGGVIPADLLKVNKEQGWTQFVLAVFKYLFHSGVTRDQIEDNLSRQPLMSGMKELLEWIDQSGGEAVVISDTFDISIKAVLAKNGIQDRVTRIMADGSHFSNDGELMIESGSDYADVRRCSVSGRRNCKGDRLRSIVEEGKYDFVCFIGDGKNDFCACMELDGERGDVALPRKRFELAKMLAEKKKTEEEWPVQVREWEDGWQIKQIIEQCLTRK